MPRISSSGAPRIRFPERGWREIDLVAVRPGKARKNMLDSLHIENIAVIERADIRFDAGFNVLTGETGAGKSIVIDAINAVLGERASRDLVRTGSDTANVSAVFSELSAPVTAALGELGFEPDEDGLLLIQRSISAEGKGSCRINGRPATVSLLRTVGRMLVNIHGQHENQTLLNPERHVEYLDRLGNLLPLLETYREAYHRLCGIRRQLKDADMDETLKARRMDLLRYQIEEIEGARLQSGEQETLLAQREMYRNAGRIAEGLMAAKLILSGDEEEPGALSLLEQVSGALTSAGRYMEEAAAVSQRVETALYELQECAGDLRELTGRLDFDPAELDRVEERLEQIRRLTGKYGSTIEEVLDYLETARQELDDMELSEERVARLQQEEEQAATQAAEAAARLTEARRETARVLVREVMEQLVFLDMPNVAMEVSMEPVPLSSMGADRVEFLLSANPGEPAKPIARIASGGELSRVMLAIKSVLADADDIDTLIFDEIDTGISGRAAQKVGIKLRQTAVGSESRRRQVLCVTHLAQIAAQGHHHLLIQKSVRDGRTFTEVTVLDQRQRERELARIINGEVTPASLQAAAEMLQKV